MRGGFLWEVLRLASWVGTSLLEACLRTKMRWCRARRSEFWEAWRSRVVETMLRDAVVLVELQGIAGHSQACYAI